MTTTLPDHTPRLVRVVPTMAADCDGRGGPEPAAVVSLVPEPAVATCRR